MQRSPAVPTQGNVLPCSESQETAPADMSWGGRLRGLRWRVMLGVLPPGPASVEELRRAAAGGRRRYAELRRRLLVDPHVMEEAHKPHHLSMDNPLSQDPESVWGRYFRNAELERTIDKDLTRLYPEHGSFFQSPVCQAMLRRILLVWSLTHPHYSYRQGMHELLAPLLYVLHNDDIHLSEVKQRYEDLFDDRFDGPSLLEISSVHENVGKQKGPSFSTHKVVLITEGSKIRGDDEWLETIAPQDLALVEPDEFGFDLRTMVLGSDIYGAEGELGALLSGRFVEHDVYSMFDALMSGKGGAVNMADYFMTANGAGSVTGLSPVLEASATLYRALAVADVSLYSHLVGLGVEPQFFALRWLRVLFGREFDLENLLLLWDAIFSVTNTADSMEESECDLNSCQYSPRSAFILALAVSMLLYLRPMLLAAPDATSCLQKLLNFPQTADVRSLIENAKMLQPLAEEAARSVPPRVGQFVHTFEQNKVRKLVQSGSGSGSGSASPLLHGHAASPKSKLLQIRHSCSPEMLRNPLPESYWEEKWKNSVFQKVVPETVGVGRPKTLGSSGHLVEKHLVPCVPGQDLVSSPVASKLEGNIGTAKERMLVDEDAHGSTGGGPDHRRKLHGGPAEGAMSQLSTDNGNDGISSRSPLDCLKSPGRSGVSGSFGNREIVRDAKIRAEDSYSCLPDVENRNSSSCVDSVLRDGSSGSTGEHSKSVFLPEDENQERFGRVTSRFATDSNVTSATSIVCKMPQENSSNEAIQGLMSNDLKSIILVGEEMSGCKAAEDSASSLNIDLRDQPSTSVAAEDAGRGSGSSSPVSRSKTLPASSHAGKFFWRWNLGKSDSGDRTSDSVQLSKDHDQPENASVMLEKSPADDSFSSKQGLLPRNDIGIDTSVSSSCNSTSGSARTDAEAEVNEDCMVQDRFSGIMTDTGLVDSTSQKEGQSSALQTLGQSMSDNIQVLETVLSQRTATRSKDGSLGASAIASDRSDHISETSPGEKGHAAALAALAELRKISNALLQM